MEAQGASLDPASASLPHFEHEEGENDDPADEDAFDEPEHPAEDMIDEVQGALHELRNEQPMSQPDGDDGGEEDQEAHEIGDVGFGDDLVHEGPGPRVIPGGQDEPGDDRHEIR